MKGARMEMEIHGTPMPCCAAAGVATGEQVPTSPGHVSTLSIHYLASGSRRYHNSFYTMLYTAQLLTTHPCPSVACSINVS